MTASTAAAAFVFLALSFLTVGFYQWRAEKGSPERRLRELQQAQRPQGLSKQALPLRRGPSSIPALRDRLTNSAWAQGTSEDLVRAGINLRVGEYLIFRLLLATVLFVVPLVAARMALGGFIAGVVLAGVGYVAPGLYVHLRQGRRRRAIEEQLAEGLTQIGNAMRAGFALLQAIDSAARRLRPPLTEELARLVTDVNMGQTLEDALVDLGARVGSYDLDMVITAILIQRRTGGNLAEVLDNVAETMRERDRVRGEIRVLTAQQRFAGWVLSVWPIVLTLIFFLLNPDVMSNLWTTPGGLVLLTIAGVLQLLGFLTIRRIVAIDI
jgi:tight adherence protein B